MKRLCLVLIVAVFLALTFSIPMAAAKQMKLHIAHWNVPKDPNTKVLQTIAKEMEEASGGTIKCEISWKALGKPSDYYDALVNGLCDIALFGPTYSPGRFPVAEMITLPIYYPSNRITVMAYYNLWKKGRLDKELSKIVPIAVGNNGGFLFMWGDKPVDKLAGLKGKKISAPYTIHSQMVKRAGGTPVSMPVQEVYVALDTGVIDGAWQIWPGMPVFSLHEVVKYATDVSMSGGPYVIGVNRSVYNKLPAKVREVLEKNEKRYSLMMADAFQGFTDLGKKIFLDSGGKITRFSPEEMVELNQLYKPIFANWKKRYKARGVPVDELLNELYDILIDLGVERPFAR
ncbi:MAG: TRAP transporter substrate-binding protein [Deltaproteobacteria bacterium]|nr:TRAP transporter substrate-binding protein [Deltaproteobacteria bacterium]